VVLLDVPQAVPIALRRLPPFPPAAARLIGLLADPDVPLDQVARILKTDAVLSAEVLRLANSPLAGARYPVGSVLQALSLLGLRRVTSLVLTLNVTRLVGPGAHSGLARTCWRHNLATALAAKAFAGAFDVDADEAYTAGLLHDAGRLALLATDPDQYERIVAQDGDLCESERACFGIDHCEAGAWLIHHWNLPAAFAEAAFAHHTPLEGAGILTALAHVGCSVADQLGFSVTGAVADHAELAAEPALDEHVSYSIAATINAIECEYAL